MNIKHITAPFIALLLIVVASSCLNDDGRDDFSNVGYVIEMLDAKPIGSSISLNATGADMQVDVRINQTGSYATDHDIVVTLGLNADAVDKYNEDDSHVAGTMVDPSWVSFPETVTIKAGTDENGNPNRVAVATLTIHSGSIPQGNYVVPLQITAVSDESVISGNFGSILFNFYHNNYDGVYKMTGKVYRFNADGSSTGDALQGTLGANLTAKIITIGEQTSTFQSFLWANGGGVGGVGSTASPRITVNADNSITLDIVDGGATPSLWGNIDGEPSYYDPATKTFYINYKWSTDGSTPPSFSNSNRAVQYVLTYVGPR